MSQSQSLAVDTWHFMAIVRKWGLGMSVTRLRLMTRNCAKTFLWKQKSDILWAADVPDPSLERSRRTATVVTHTLGPCPVHSTAITCNYCTTKIHPAHHRKAHCRVEATDPDHAKL